MTDQGVSGRQHILAPPAVVRVLLILAALLMWPISVIVCGMAGPIGFPLALGMLLVPGLLMRAGFRQGLYLSGQGDLEVRTVGGDHVVPHQELSAVQILGTSGFVIIVVAQRRYRVELVSRSGFVSLRQSKVDRAVKLLAEGLPREVVVSELPLVRGALEGTSSLEVSRASVRKALVSVPVLASLVTGLPIVAASVWAG